MAPWVRPGSQDKAASQFGYDEPVRKAELLDLFDFVDYVWDEFGRAIPESQLSRIAPGSGWPTLRHCLGHMLAAHERWIPAILELKTGTMPEYGPSDLVNWMQLDAERERIRAPLRERIETLSDDALAETHDVNVDGEVLQYSRGELAAHLLLHERGHHGDVTTLLWQLDIDVDIAIEYRFFLDYRR